MRRDVPKRPYTVKFLKEQKRRLLDERAKIQADIDADEAELLSWQSGEVSGMSQHPADDATAVVEKEIGVTLIGNARHILTEIDDALERIEDESYGWDEEGRCWIREERLRALPWARREIETQSQYEKRSSPHVEGYTHDTGITTL